MVKGEWIFFVNDLRCKNWINGIEVVFSFDDAGMVIGKIRHVPQKLMEQLPNAFDLAVYVYRMRRQATNLFRKIYQKKTRFPRKR